MSSVASNLDESGLEVSDIDGDSAFLARPLHPSDTTAQLEGLRRIARAFVESPETILQHLVDAAVDLCGADSAGISIEKEDGTEEHFYHWVATAGQYSAFLDAILPRYPSACGVCLERGQPQHFRVGWRFFEIMGIEAPLVTDGILLPWQTEEARGTIFIMAHERTEAFDRDDARIMQLLADFAAMGIRQRQEHQLLLKQAGAIAAASMANQLAHQINNPLQGLVNLVFLAAQSPSCAETKALAQDLSEPLQQLSELVAELLRLPQGNTSVS
jgi:hypothetical protein